MHAGKKTTGVAMDASQLHKLCWGDVAVECCSEDPLIESMPYDITYRASSSPHLVRFKLVDTLFGGGGAWGVMLVGGYDVWGNIHGRGCGSDGWLC